MSPSPRILFFADAGAVVGGGHVMRCLTLAGAVVRQGGRCAFAAPPAAAAVLEVFAGPEIERLPLPDGRPDRLATPIAELTRDWGAQGLVIDHFGFSRGEEAVVRAVVRRLLALDDLKREHTCDLVLDSNLDRTAADYPGVGSLTGPGFALVRPEFAALRPAALDRRKAGGPVRRTLVALGLTDVGGITGRVVQAILPALGDETLDIVLGGRAPSLADLRSLAARDGRLTLHIDSRDMARLTAEADLAIGAGGSSVWERCCLGLPSLTLVLADNQKGAARALEDRGATLRLDVAEADVDARLAEAYRKLVGDTPRRQAMVEAASAICDGEGADRVAERLLAML
ncbi:MAG: UDP-2,4-diacetamido-2,4,6-trideoxy-beta-L-altropyranose hydrolase [Caulobacteraceae bacterium]|nr:UDP-2,4-diacetamido-2,4,6-trideoxy-beta-L-altropyranose hydrolase [Caulobacteraceae bacterium]